MPLPEEGRAGMTTWTPPDRNAPYSVILADDFGVTRRALESWDHYAENLGKVEEVRVSFAGIEGLPISEHDLARFVALGSTGAGLALSGANCGYGGEGPHGTERILLGLGVPAKLASMVLHQRDLRFVQGPNGFWAAEVDPE